MSADIITSLQLDSEFVSSRVIVVKELNGCDSSFIISCVLSHCIKNKNAVLIVTTHNSVTHYQNVGLKMNYNLQRCIDYGEIFFYNLSEENLNNVLDNGDGSVETLCSNLKTKINSIKEKHDRVHVIMDGISHLFDMQYSLKDVNRFCKEVITFLKTFNNSFILIHCNVASEDDVTHVMANLLSHKAHILLEVENLSSGWSADVSGHLTIKNLGCKFEDEHMFTMGVKPSRYLFKLFDRGVKLFAPGTV